jgi:alanyl-tRNA synthetase
MTSTTLLYHRDPMLLGFDATVVAHGVHGGKPSVILDETAFYPEAGGQMADRGVLAGLPVVDVQVDDAGVVHHLVQLEGGGGLPVVGARVRGDIDKPRRRQFMALHTAQHMLSRALLDEAGAETVSARLGESVCTIDVDVAGLADNKVARAEALVNAVVDDDVGIRAFFPAPAELASLPLRRKPKVTENIRVVEVKGFDVSPCGGTHCTSTAQVGLVRVTGLERYKGMMRVSFQAGPRARAEVFERSRALESLAKELSTSPVDVAAAVDKLRESVKAGHGEKLALVERLASLLAAQLAASSTSGPNPNEVVATVPVGGAEMIRAIAPVLTGTHGKDALLAAATSDGVQVLLQRAPSSTLDCGALLKKIAAATGGRGGGKPERAEGRVPAGVDWAGAVAAARAS